MLDHLGYGARAQMHTDALKELFRQVKDNRDIHIKDIGISTPVDGGDWKDFILQTIGFAGGNEVWPDEDRPFTDYELELMLQEKTFGNLFSQPLEDAGLIPINDSKLKTTTKEELQKATIEALQEIKDEMEEEGNH